VIRSPTGSERHSSSAFSVRSSLALYFSAISSRRSAASSRRLSTTSSIRSRSSGSISSYTTRAPALTMPMSSPAPIAWNRKTEWIASRTGLFPRNENDTLEMPPETSAPGRFSLIQRVASMKSTP
jgi:hypothetical protein